MAIDEVSKMIGNFESLLKTQGETLVEIRDRVEEMNKYQRAQNGKVEKLRAWHESVTQEDGEFTIAVEQANDWAETKKKMKWLAGIGIFGGSVGGFSFSKFFANLMGHV